MRSNTSGKTSLKASKLDASISQTPANGDPYFFLRVRRKTATVFVDSFGNFTLPFVEPENLQLQKKVFPYKDAVL